MVLVGATGEVLVTWPIAGPGLPDLSVVDTVARTQLCARAAGWSIQLRDVCSELAELLDLAGLTGAVGG